MVDQFQTFTPGLTSPAIGAFAITPDDGENLGQVTRALYVGVSGDVSVTLKNGDDVTLVNVQAGTVLPLRLARVKATGTSAQDMVGLV